MKAQIAIAALISAAAVLTPANASTTTTLSSSFSSTNPGTISFTCSPTNTACSTYTVSATGLNGVFGSTTVTSAPSTITNNGTSTGVAVNSITGNPGKGDLGLNDSTDTGQIPLEDGLQLDFASLLSKTALGTLQSISFTVQTTIAGTTNPPYWGMYEGNTSSAAGDTLLSVSNSSGKDGSIYSQTMTITSNFDDYYILALTNGDCAIDLSSITLTYNSPGVQNTPEPGTFVMGGMALMALGVMMKKRNKKA